MDFKKRLPVWLLYSAAALVLIIFLSKNTAAYETHLIDVRNSAGPPLAVGADVPDFTVTDTSGNLLESSQLPEKCVLVIGSTTCPYFRDAMRAYNTAGEYQGISALYAVYLEAESEDEIETVADASQEFEGIRVYRDYENSVKWAFRCSDYPTTLILENGKVVAKEVGFHGEVTEAGENKS